ncbi:type I secretion system permease/ATPase [Noviherbaspirillum pedocola]|uniref:Cyclolysin secretion/processing ATP-binding protein CyaB n=1 Tax=Noviherbaspirillum pedocola TaxID=2801341 RepID=A0A934SZB2_9BURK|nr:type I secretion system permease/ATPase [Noviherbaspirillum pedocola]MBK4738453.1 type I secretion system permease/ATPase [Noviherbaspirillum pedocola]
MPTVDALELPHAAPAANEETDDALLDCLLALVRFHELPATRDSLCAGLPRDGGRFTPQLLVRAAQRAGLVSCLVEQDFEALTSEQLPALLLLRDGTACVLGGIQDDSAQLLAPAGTVELASLRLRYAGELILATPREGAAAVRPDRWLLRILTPLWPLYAEVLAASLMVNLFAVCMPLFTMNVYDRVVPNAAGSTLWALSAGMAMVLLFDVAMRALRGRAIEAAGRQLDMQVSCRIFERLLTLSLAARPASAGAFGSRLQEFECVREFLTAATISALVDLPFVVVYLAAMFWIGGGLGWLAVTAIVVIVIAGFALQAPMAASLADAARVAARRQALLLDTLGGLETIRAANAEGRLQRRWERLVAEAGDWACHARALAGGVQQVSQCMQQLAYLLVVIAGVTQVLDEKQTIGGVIACSILAGRALAPWSQVASLLTRYHQARAALATVRRLLEMPVERSGAPAGLERSQLRGEIEFRDVHFSYPGQHGEALAGVSFRIAAGERVGVIGCVDSGKTTLEKLIVAFYAPQRGTVAIDGINARQIDPAALRRAIGHVPQDVLLFAGSIRDNIALGAPEADDAAVLRAAELGGVTDFVDRWSDGYAREVGERGAQLSGGQRQAIAIARAELFTPPILLMDEPSSAMDAISEARFRERLAARLGKRTLILVSHRTSLLALVDRVLVLDGGRLVADGPRDRVLAALAAGKSHVVS